MLGVRADQQARRPTLRPRFREALERLGPVERVLDLGCHTSDELLLIERYVPGAAITAVDRDASALAVARSRFPAIDFIEADVMNREVGQFDLVVAIGLLQRGEIDDRELLRRIMQRHLTPTGAVILGIPNCRYVDGEIEYGARMRNFSQPELGLVIKDIAFYRRYLQQHDRQVFVTGKHYLFVTAVAA